MMKQLLRTTLFGLFLALISTSCQTTAPRGQSETKTASVFSVKREQPGRPDAGNKKSQDTARYWYTVSKDPMVYLPVGYPSKSPRTHRDGEWVRDQATNTKWFIPYGGTEERTAEELTASAFSLRSRRTRSREALGTGLLTCVEVAWKAPLSAALLGGCLYTGADPEKIAELWDY